MFYKSEDEDIKAGTTTDIYFERTAKILKDLNKNPLVSMEVFLKNFPEDYSWGVFSGLEECLGLLGGIKGLDLYSIPEGKIFNAKQPVMLIRGRYLDFGRHETSILGFLCHSSGIATKAARIKMAAAGKMVYNFGARRAHPAITPMIERSAFIGGLDGVSTSIGAKAINEAPVGTMPHALVLIVSDTLKSLEAFDRVIEKEVPRIALIDTFNDEKFEALNLAENFKGKLYGLRLDTPGSRRGDFKTILEEVRWELDIRDYDDIKLMISGGLDEQDIKELKDIVDAFGVGTSISNARVIDFSMDIVEIDGKKISKIGKKSGTKKIIACTGCGYEKTVLFSDNIKKYDCPECGQYFIDIYKKMISGGKIINKVPDSRTIRKKVLDELKARFGNKETGD